ncbi:MAG: hypothetical protein R8K20_01250 [Gallionellaceae bacterium]
MGAIAASRARSLAVSNTLQTPPRPDRLESTFLAPGSQQAMIDAARHSQLIGLPLNRTLTIRTAALRNMGGGGVFREGHPADCVRIFLELQRKWTTHRGLGWAALWVREYGKQHQEHLHLLFHQGPLFDSEHLIQVAAWTGEAIDAGKHTREIVGQSELDSWQVKQCIRDNTSGITVAAYLGKAEPNTIVTGWGKRKLNDKKPVTKRYSPPGLITGNTTQKYRWGTSRILGPKERQGYGKAN